MPALRRPRPTISGSPATGIGEADNTYGGRATGAAASLIGSGFPPDTSGPPAATFSSPGIGITPWRNAAWSSARSTTTTPYYIGPNYYYSPSVCIDTPVLTGYLFCRPAYCHYYFGDYYDPMYVGVGIYPWYAVRRHGYEPLFVYDRWYYGRRDPGWEVRMRGDYAYRVAHIDARPPHTYAAAMRLNVGAGGVRFTLAAPIGRVAAGGGAMRFEHISTERR